jgi:hypothetical protein
VLLQVVPAEEPRAVIGEGRHPIQQHRRAYLLKIEIRGWEYDYAGMYGYLPMQTHEIPRVV